MNLLSILLQTPAGGSQWSGILMMVVIVAIFYFFMIRPQQKKQKEMKKNSKTVSLKETQLSPTIDVHDKNVKLKRTLKWLESGDKVKIAVRFRGRQLAHIDIGQKILDDFVAECADYCVIEKPAKLEGRTLTAILAPKKK